MGSLHLNNTKPAGENCKTYYIKNKSIYIMSVEMNSNSKKL